MSLFKFVSSALGLEREAGDGIYSRSFPVAAAVERVIVASIVPLLTTAALWYSRTVIEVKDPESCQWVQLWLSSTRQGAGSSIRRVRRLLLLPSSSNSSRGGNGHRVRNTWNDDEDDDFFLGEETTDEDDDKGGVVASSNIKVNNRSVPAKFSFLPANGVPVFHLIGYWPVSVSSLEGGEEGMRINEFGRMRYSQQGYKITIWFSPFGTDVAARLLVIGRQLWLNKRAQRTEIWLHDPTCSPARFDIATRKSRPLNSVIVENNIKNSLCNDAETFLRSEDWYVRKGIPYRRGYLLYGPPGCGKTSLVKALAAWLQLPIVLISLGSGTIQDDCLISALGAAPKESIILIEDVDVAFRNAKDKDPYDPYGCRSVTLSGLLNAIDGVAAQEGRLVFFTTNHREKLSEALLRPGRIDVEYFLGYASKTGAGELFDQFFSAPLSLAGNKKDGDSNTNSKQCTGHVDDEKQKLLRARDAFIAEVQPGVHSFAKLQGVLMKARDDPLLAATGMRDLFKNQIEEGCGLDIDIFSGKEPGSDEDDDNTKDTESREISELRDDIHAYVSLIEHAALCKGEPECASLSCKGAKKSILHANKECDVTPRSKCKQCSFLVMIATEHFKRCNAKAEGNDTPRCHVPFCDVMREKKARDKEAYMESLFETQSSRIEDAPPNDQKKEAEGEEKEEVE